MGIFDRFRSADESRGRTYEGERVEPSGDEQALARYRYMLKTAPPETIEQAHVEAFARLTPEQRRMLLEQLRAEMPEAERAYAADNPQSLARLATRAEVREPGTMERAWNRMGTMPGAGMGLGGMFAGSLLASMAGSVLGTMMAQQFFTHHPEASHLFGGADAGAPASGDLADDPWQGLELQNDAAADVPDFDGGMDGGFDV